jgi:hypothetical protein
MAYDIACALKYLHALISCSREKTVKVEATPSEYSLASLLVFRAALFIGILSLINIAWFQIAINDAVGGDRL